VGRGIPRTKIAERLATGGRCLVYERINAVYYAGPAKGHPRGIRLGRVGPTTAGRMDGLLSREFPGPRGRVAGTGQTGKQVCGGGLRLQGAWRLIHGSNWRFGGRKLAQECINTKGWM